MTNSSGKRFRSGLTYATAAAACLCTPISGSTAAHATGYADALISEQVNIADLDLGVTAGQRQLKERIHSAAVRVCNFDGFLDTSCVDMATVDELNQGTPASLASRPISRASSRVDASGGSMNKGFPAAIT